MIPPGICTSTGSVVRRRPRPRQSVQGESMRAPRPRHAGQVDVCTNCPKAVFETCCTWPLPPHVGQVAGVVPGSAPEPLQRSHSTMVSTSTSRVTPKAASARVSSTAAVASPPRAGRRTVENRSSPKNAPSRSDRFEKSMNCSGWNWVPAMPACPNRS